jgi:hypothetical protein
LRRLFHIPPPVLPRLTREQALELARSAAAGTPLAGQRTMTIIGEIEGRNTWFVRTPTVGSALVVTIDDESGTVKEMKRHGIR